MEDFVYTGQCDLVPHEALAVGIGSTRKVPKFVKWICAEGKCSACKEKLRMGEYSVLNNCSETIEVLEWKDAPRQGTQGGEKTQFELGL